MISAILQPLTKTYSRLIAMGNHGEMEATRLPGEVIAHLPLSYHNGFMPGAFVEHVGRTILPCDLVSKFEALSNTHLAYCDESKSLDPYSHDASTAAAIGRIWRDLQTIASALFTDEQIESLPLWSRANPHGTDPDTIRAALEGDAYARFDLYRANQPD